MARRRYREGTGSENFGGLFGTSFGYVGTSIYFVLGAIGLYALGVAPLLILVMGFAFVATAWSYAEGSAAMPESSGVTSFARRAFGPLAGFVAAWALLLDSIILVAIVCSFIPSYLSVFWPQLQDWPNDFFTSLAVLIVIVALNILGAHESVRLNTLMALLGLASLVLLVVVGFFVAVRPGVVWDQIDLGTAPTWHGLLYAVPLAAAAFIGLDAISSRAEKARRPGTDVPRAINIVLPLIVALAVGLAVLALSALPVGSNVVPVDPATGLTVPVAVVPGSDHETFVLADDPASEVVVPVEASGAGHVIPAQEPSGPVTTSPDGPVTRLYGTLLGSAYLEDPVMGLVDSLPDDLGGLKDLLRPWFAVLIAVSLLLSANAVVGGSARVVFSLARHHQLPAGLGRVHSTRMTPYVGVVLLGIVVVVLLVPSDPLLLLELFGFGAALAFTLANASVVALRYKEPSISRPFAIPFTVRSRGIPLPVPAVAGGVAMVVVWVLMLVTHPVGAVVGFAWLGAGLVFYVVYRRTAGYPLLVQPPEAALPAAALSDVDYDRILVPVVGTRLSDEMMVLGCQLAAEKSAVIDVLYVLEVPMNLPLEASLPEGRARGKHVLDTAMAVAREFGVEAWPHLVSARSPGRAIVDTAGEWNADVVIMGAVRRPRADGKLVSDTVAHVMRQARAEVLLNLVGEDYPMRGSAAEYDAEQAAAKATSAPPVTSGV
jgi:amino acid transporter/nucleotide-binding universal stress UspA family protein